MADTTYTDAELRERLTPEQYAVTQQAGTERAFTGEYWDCHDDGTYRCIVCDTALLGFNIWGKRSLTKVSRSRASWGAIWTSDVACDTSVGTTARTIMTNTRSATTVMIAVAAVREKPMSSSRSATGSMK